MTRMAAGNPIDVLRAIATGTDCIGVLALTYGYDPINRAARDGLLTIAPHVTLTKWGHRALRDAELDRAARNP